MNRLLSAALVLLAVAGWPSDGWSRTSRHACDVNRWATERLENWKKQLGQSTPDNPAPIVGTYDENGVLLPTCANGPLTNKSKPETITGYFKSFLKDKPVVTYFEKTIVGGVCGNAFASGLYTFELNDGHGPTLRARFTFVFRQDLIMQHHSSLEPRAPDQKCPPPHPD